FAVFEAGKESAVDPAFTVGPQRARLGAVGSENGAAAPRS
ncbi:MAG: hypothetical protein QOI56_394, partial [Actinomycetota bacterium]|nr:hypothetical protein [Actinomycetota bacterium]